MLNYYIMSDLLSTLKYIIQKFKDCYKIIVEIPFFISIIAVFVAGIISIYYFYNTYIRIILKGYSSTEKIIGLAIKTCAYLVGFLSSLLTIVTLLEKYYYFSILIFAFILFLDWLLPRTLTKRALKSQDFEDAVEAEVESILEPTEENREKANEKKENLYSKIYKKYYFFLWLAVFMITQILRIIFTFFIN